jgi:hypothetical protein
MSLEKVKMNESISSGLVAGTRSGEGAMAMGYFTIQCFDKDGKLKWEDENHNLVVNLGLQYMCGTALTSTAQITTWYIGLYGSGATNSPAAGDNMLTHPTWTEITPYSNATRPACTFAAATLANPSVATNTASPAAFTINSTATVGGAFLVGGAPGTANVKGGTGGTLFSAADFASPGDRNVVSGDTINLTYTLSLAG